MANSGEETIPKTFYINNKRPLQNYNKCSKFKQRNNKGAITIQGL